MLIILTFRNLSAVDLYRLVKGLLFYFPYKGKYIASGGILEKLPYYYIIIEDKRSAHTLFIYRQMYKRTLAFFVAIFSSIGRFSNAIRVIIMDFLLLILYLNDFYGVACYLVSVLNIYMGNIWMNDLLLQAIKRND